MTQQIFDYKASAQAMNVPDGAMSQIPLAGPLLAPVVASIPQAAGKRTSLVTDKTFNPLANHGLDPLIGALEKKMENPQIDVIAKGL